MADVAHVWGSDLQLSASGDLATVSDDAETQQRILHRLLTNAGDYIWELAYGAGLPVYVGQPINVDAIGAVIRQQMAYESTVATSPEPVVTALSTTNGTLTVTIQYADAATGATQILSFPVSA
jgi:phage baseplate assembly protein W